MGHRLEAIVGKTEDIKSFAEDWVHAEYIELVQGFGMIKLNNDLLDDINDLAGKSGADPYNEFTYLSQSLSELLKNNSDKTRLAYVETEYFGGIGAQIAILYENGEPVKGPLKTESTWDNVNQKFVHNPEGDRAINSILKFMGVYRKGELDEFDSIKLGWYG